MCEAVKYSNMEGFYGDIRMLSVCLFNVSAYLPATVGLNFLM